MRSNSGRRRAKGARYPPATVGALIVNPTGQVFLGRSDRWGGRFSVPGGHIELGERAEDAIVREVREETGLRVRPKKLLLVQQAIFPTEFTRPEHFIFLDYLCELTGSPRIRLDRRELQGYVWTTPWRALRLDLEHYTRTLLRHYLRMVKLDLRVPPAGREYYRTAISPVAPSTSSRSPVRRRSKPPVGRSTSGMRAIAQPETVTRSARRFTMAAGARSARLSR